MRLTVTFAAPDPCSIRKAGNFPANTSTTEPGEQNPMTTDTASHPSTAPGFVRALNPLICRLLRIGMPMGPNALVTVRGRTSGQPRTFAVGVFEVDGRGYIMGSFGETNWVRNLRVAREAIVHRGRRQEWVRAAELSPQQAGPILRDALAPFLARRMMAPMIRSWYGVDGRSTDADFLAQALAHPMFELTPGDTPKTAR